MFYGEHLSAEEALVKCACGVVASTEVHDRFGHSCGWFCRRCADRKRWELRKQAKLARAIVRKGRP
jgi:hypothetical protein